MRFIYCVLFSSLLVACHEQVPGAGERDNPCRTGITWTGPCNEGLRCVDNVCRVCGGDGEFCCGEAGGSQTICHNGTACDDFVDKVGTCTTTCGSPGLECCDYQTCPNGGDCENGMCTGTPNPPSGGSCATWEEGDTKHHIYANLADGSSQQIIVYTATIEEAEACRQEIANLAAPNEEVCDLNVEPKFEKFCDNNTNNPPAIGHDFYYCDDAHLQDVQAFWCSTCSWSAGACP